jgi:gluconate 2-dehydrogenase gamma chain
VTGQGDIIGQPFVACTGPQQLELVTKIAYPKRTTPDMQAGVAFFNHMCDLTATGFFSSKIGMADIGYVGNSPNH